MGAFFLQVTEPGDEGVAQIALGPARLEEECFGGARLFGEFHVAECAGGAHPLMAHAGCLVSIQPGVDKRQQAADLARAIGQETAAKSFELQNDRRVIHNEDGFTSHETREYSPWRGTDNDAER
jgi:hypothetical protein